MKYKDSLINITNSLESSAEMYSLILLRAKGLSMTLSGVRCFLDGSYLLCLSIEDELTVHSGVYEAITLRFIPAFYNVNLTHSLIQKPIYQDMRTRYGYPDFHQSARDTSSPVGMETMIHQKKKLPSKLYGKSFLPLPLIPTAALPPMSRF